MRVALVGTGVEPIPPTGYGGIERTIDELATALRGRGLDVVVVNQVRHRRMRDEYAFALRLPKLLGELRADVVHAHTPVVANRLALRGVPYVFTTHSRHWFDRRGWSQRWGYFLERRAVRLSQITILLTDRLRSAVQSALGSHPPRLAQIPIGVDSSRFVADWSRRTGHTVLGIGAVVPEKQWELAARAMDRLDARLRVVGPVQDTRYARRLAGVSPKLELVGEVPEVQLAQELARADVLAHPSRVELLPGAVLQAMAAELPVVGGPALAGIVRDGTTGWVAPSGSEEFMVGFLTARLRELLGDAEKRREMGRAAREVAQREYSWSQVAEEHGKLYREIATNRSGTTR